MGKAKPNKMNSSVLTGSEPPTRNSSGDGRVDDDDHDDAKEQNADTGIDGRKNERHARRSEESAYLLRHETSVKAIVKIQKKYQS